MKILFASDIHGSVADMFLLAERIAEEKPDKTVFLGDFCGTGNAAAFREAVKKISSPLIYVEGNCDSPAALDRYGLPRGASEYTAVANGKFLYATHGHLRNRRCLPEALRSERSAFSSAGADERGREAVFLYGHLHTPFIEREDGILFVNCGSMARPRNGAVKTYAVLDEQGVRIRDGEYGETLAEWIFSE